MSEYEAVSVADDLRLRSGVEGEQVSRMYSESRTVPGTTTAPGDLVVDRVEPGHAPAQSGRRLASGESCSLVMPGMVAAGTDI